MAPKGLLIPLVCLALSAPLMAQENLQRFERQLEQIRRDTRLRSNENIPLGQRTLIDYGAFTTFNYLSLDDPTLHNRGLRQYDFTAYGEVNVDGVHDFFVRGRAFYRDFNPGDQFDEHGDAWDGRLERAFYRFDLARYLATTRGVESQNELTIKAGRDLTVWANGLTLSTELDGVVVDFGRGPFQLEVVAGITPLDTVDFDSSRPNFDDHTKRGFFGAILSTRVGTHRPFIYALAQRDYNDSDAVISAGGVNVATSFDYNSNYFGIGSTGAITDRLAYGVEFAYETGDTLSNSFAISPAGALAPVGQQRDDISAWAFDAQLDYVLSDARATRFSGEMILASGDDDRLVTSNTFGGNAPGTTDRAFNAFGLLNTGLAFAPSVSNLIVLRGGASTFPFPTAKPFKRMQVGSDLFFFAKLDEDGPIDEPTTADRVLGFEPDVYMNWQITSDVTLALRYGAFIPGEAIVNDGKIRQFFYAGVTFAF
jgi:hypothetical protein